MQHPVLYKAVTTLGLTVCTLWITQAVAYGLDKPNVVILFADDAGYTSWLRGSQSLSLRSGGQEVRDSRQTRTRRGGKKGENRSESIRARRDSAAANSLPGKNSSAARLT